MRLHGPCQRIFTIAPPNKVIEDWRCSMMPASIWTEGNLTRSSAEDAAGSLRITAVKVGRDRLGQCRSDEAYPERG